jgi:hypothetical protein
MATFQVFLTRDYIVDIEAKNRREAAECTEFFVSGGLDASTEKEQEHWNFKILQIRPTVNEAFEIHEVPNAN